MTTMTEFTSKVLRTGKRGRPPMEPHSSITVRMRKKRHMQMIDYCVGLDTSQREFLEQAAQLLIADGKFAELIKKRRRHPSQFDADNQKTSFVTLRINKRLMPRVVSYCIDHDVSQVEFVELAIETLTRNHEFSQRMKARRAQLLEQRNAYHTT